MLNLDYKKMMQSSKRADDVFRFLGNLKKVCNESRDDSSKQAAMFAFFMVSFGILEERLKGLLSSIHPSEIWFNNRATFGYLLSHAGYSLECLTKNRNPKDFRKKYLLGAPYVKDLLKKLEEVKKTRDKLYHQLLSHDESFPSTVKKIYKYLELNTVSYVEKEITNSAVVTGYKPVFEKRNGILILPKCFTLELLNFVLSEYYWLATHPS